MAKRISKKALIACYNSLIQTRAHSQKILPVKKFTRAPGLSNVHRLTFYNTYECILRSTRYGSCRYHMSDAHEHGRERPVAQSTIDEEEREKFTKLSQLWWDELGEFKALHAMNKIRVPFIKDALVQNRLNLLPSPSQPLEGLTILDAGSGGGILSEPLARLGAFVVGIDMVEESIKIAQRHLEDDPSIAGKIKYIQASVEDLIGTEEGTFDAVVASEVVEHVADLPSFISSCSRLLKPGGYFFITTLNKTFLSKALAIFAAEKILKIVPDGAHDWDKFVEPDVLKYELLSNGLSVRLIHGLCYNPVTCEWSWIQDTSVNYAVYAVKPIHADEDISEGVKKASETEGEESVDPQGESLHQDSQNK